MILYKTRLLLLYVCMFAFAHILSMDTFSKKFAAYKSNSNATTGDDFKQLVAEGRKLAQENNAQKKRIAMILHPDRNLGHEVIANAFFQEVTRKDSQSEILPDEGTKEDFQTLLILKKTQRLEQRIQQLEEYSPFTATLLQGCQQNLHMTVGGFTVYIIEVAFTLLADRTMPGHSANSELQRITKQLNKKLDKCKKITVGARQALQANNEYQEHLKEQTARVDQKTQKMLIEIKERLNKEKK